MKKIFFLVLILLISFNDSYALQGIRSKLPTLYQTATRTVQQHARTGGPRLMSTASKMSLKEAYETLGLSENATLEQVKTAYKELAKKADSEIAKNMSLEEATQRMKILDEARDSIINSSNAHKQDIYTGQQQRSQQQKYQEKKKQYQEKQQQRAYEKNRQQEQNSSSEQKSSYQEGYFNRFKNYIKQNTSFLVSAVPPATMSALLANYDRDLKKGSEQQNKLELELENQRSWLGYFEKPTREKVIKKIVLAESYITGKIKTGIQNKSLPAEIDLDRAHVLLHQLSQNALGSRFYKEHKDIALKIQSLERKLKLLEIGAVQETKKLETVEAYA